MVLGSIALLLIAADAYTPWLRPVHTWLDRAALPFYWMTSLLARVSEWGEGKVVDRGMLESRNAQLETELLVHKGQLQRMVDLAAENTRLRSLLNATQLLKDKVLVTELIGVSPDPLVHAIVIDRGTNDGVNIGQPVLDGDGLMGQVTAVSATHSRVLLITDVSHALPVRVLRNGVRTIAEGTGEYDRLRLRYVSPTLDIQVEDVLVSSGLGGRFPGGYPVGRVTHIERDPGQAFMEVSVTPTAHLDRSRHLLVVFSATDDLQTRNSIAPR